MTRSELVELGAPKMEGQFLAWRPMSYFIKKAFFNKVWFFGEQDPLDYVEI
jgi:hypothetical protein